MKTPVMVVDREWTVAEVLRTRRFTDEIRHGLWVDGATVELDLRPCFERRALEVLRVVSKTRPAWREYHVELEAAYGDGGLSATMELACHRGCRPVLAVSLSGKFHAGTDEDGVMLGHEDLASLTAYLRGDADPPVRPS